MYFRSFTEVHLRRIALCWLGPWRYTLSGERGGSHVPRLHYEAVEAAPRCGNTLASTTPCGRGCANHFGTEQHPVSGDADAKREDSCVTGRRSPIMEPRSSTWNPDRGTGGGLGRPRSFPACPRGTTPLCKLARVDNQSLSISCRDRDSWHANAARGGAFPRAAQATSHTGR